MSRRGAILGVVLAFAATLLPPAALPARAATITVTTTTDELTTNGQCSLREAVRNAKATGQPHPDCAAGTFRGDTIVLPAGTFQLTIAGRGENLAATGDLDVRGALTIQGTKLHEQRYEVDSLSTK